MDHATGPSYAKYPLPEEEPTLREKKFWFAGDLVVDKSSGGISEIHTTFIKLVEECNCGLLCYGQDQRRIDYPGV